MPSDPFLVNPSVETAHWLPGILKDFGIAHLFNDFTSFNKRLFFLSYAKISCCFFLSLSFWAFSSFFWCMFSVPEDKRPLGTASICLGHFTFPPLLSVPSKHCEQSSV